MRAYLSDEQARRRIVERLRERGRLEVDDLLRYLEDISSEPGGGEAYCLSVSLRGMGVSVKNMSSLLWELRDRLECIGESQPWQSKLQKRFDATERNLNGRRETESRSAQGNERPAAKAGVAPPAPASPALKGALPPDPELLAAEAIGRGVVESHRNHFKVMAFHSMAALALYWVYFKPTTDLAPQPSCWIEEDVIRMFP